MVYIPTEDFLSFNNYFLQANIVTSLTPEVTPLTSKVTKAMAMQIQYPALVYWFAEYKI